MLYTLRDNAVEDTEALNILVVNSSGIDVRPPLLHLNIRPANDSKINCSLGQKLYAYYPLCSVLSSLQIVYSGSIVKKCVSLLQRLW